MRGKIILASLLLGVSLLQAQTPAPVIVQPAPGSMAPTPPPAAAAEANVAIQAALQALQAVKAANEEVLKKQAATILQLEEMEKAAEQIKIYSKRG